MQHNEDLMRALGTVQRFSRTKKQFIDQTIAKIVLLLMKVSKYFRR